MPPGPTLESTTKSYLDDSEKKLEYFACFRGFLKTDSEGDTQRDHAVLSLTQELSIEIYPFINVKEKSDSQ